MRTASTTTTCSRPVISRLSHSTLVRCSPWALAQTQTAVFAPLATSCRISSPNVSSLLEPSSTTTRTCPPSGSVATTVPGDERPRERQSAARQ